MLCSLLAKSSSSGSSSIFKMTSFGLLQNQYNSIDKFPLHSKKNVSRKSAKFVQNRECGRFFERVPSY